MKRMTEVKSWNKAFKIYQYRMRSGNQEKDVKQEDEEEEGED